MTIAPSPAFARRGAMALASRRTAVVLSATSRAALSAPCSMKLPPMAVPALLTRIPMRASSRSRVSTVASSSALVRSAWMMSIATPVSCCRRADIASIRAMSRATSTETAIHLSRRRNKDRIAGACRRSISVRSSLGLFEPPHSLCSSRACISRITRSDSGTSPSRPSPSSSHRRGLNFIDIVNRLAGFSASSLGAPSSRQAADFIAFDRRHFSCLDRVSSLRDRTPCNRPRRGHGAVRRTEDRGKTLSPAGK